MISSLKRYNTLRVNSGEMISRDSRKDSTICATPSEREEQTLRQPCTTTDPPKAVGNVDRSIMRPRQQQVYHSQTMRTCVKICHATMTILTDCTGRRRITRATNLPPAPSNSTDTKYRRRQARVSKARRVMAIVSAISPAPKPSHLVQVKDPRLFVYPSSQTEQSAHERDRRVGEQKFVNSYGANLGSRPMYVG